MSAAADTALCQLKPASSLLPVIRDDLAVADINQIGEDERVDLVADEVHVAIEERDVDAAHVHAARCGRDVAKQAERPSPADAGHALKLSLDEQVVWAGG